MSSSLAERGAAATAQFSELAARYAAVRAVTMRLAAPLSDEDCQVQSMPDASPAKWHLAHLTWFFETFLLERFECDFTAFDPRFRVLFNSYYQGVGDQHPRAQRGLISRPSLQVVKQYRAQVDDRMQALLVRAAAEVALQAEVHSLTTLGLHHEQQHQELLLTDIKHLLSFGAHAPPGQVLRHAADESAYAKRWPIGAVRSQPLRWFDYAVDEQCAQYRECDALLPFVNAGKPVLQIEYQGTTSSFCPAANARNFNAVKKRLSLDAYRVACR